MILDPVWKEWESIGLGDSLLIALIAIFIVFLVLIIIILVVTIIQKGMEVIEKRTSIMPRKENEILNEDNDAIIATLVATIEFHKETGKDARVISIKKVED